MMGLGATSSGAYGDTVGASRGKGGALREGDGIGCHDRDPDALGRQVFQEPRLVLSGDRQQELPGVGVDDRSERARRVHCALGLRVHEVVSLAGCVRVQEFGWDISRRSPVEQVRAPAGNVEFRPIAVQHCVNRRRQRGQDL